VLLVRTCALNSKLRQQNSDAIRWQQNSHAPVMQSGGNRTVMHQSCNPVANRKYKPSQKQKQKQTSMHRDGFDRILHSKMPLVPRPLLCMQLEHACAQWHSFRESTCSYRCHHKFRLNAEGSHHELCLNAEGSHHELCLNAEGK
jgi:hypothetical protein